MLSDKEKNRRKNTKRERNQAVIDMYSSEKYTLKEVGEAFGISRKRVHQIIKREGIIGKHVAKARNRKNQIEIKCQNCEKKKKVKKSRKDQKYCSIDCFKEDSLKYTDEELINKLKRIKEKYGKLTSVLIMEESPPSYTTFRHRLGKIKKIRSLLND